MKYVYRLEHGSQKQRLHHFIGGSVNLNLTEKFPTLKGMSVAEGLPVKPQKVFSRKTTWVIHVILFLYQEFS